MATEARFLSNVPIQNLPSEPPLAIYEFCAFRVVTVRSLSVFSSSHAQASTTDSGSYLILGVDV